MKTTLYFNNKIEMRRSPIHGWGVFAKEDIASGEILEEVPFLIVPMTKGEVSSMFIDYRFNFPSGDWKYQALPLGFACIYNHSNTPNAGWYTDEENEIFVFTTSKDIKKDEEICTYYGDGTYWNDGRARIEVK